MGQRTASHRDRFFDGSPEMLCIIDREGRFVEVNPSWERKVGSPAAQLLSRSVTDFVHPDDLVATAAALERLRASAGAMSFNHRFRRGDGGYLAIAWSASAFDDDQVSFAVVRDDATGEVELRRYKALADAAPDMIGIAALDGVCLYMNPGGLALMGRERPEDWPGHVGVMIPPDLIEQYRKEILPEVRVEGSYTWDTEIMHLDGSRIPVRRAIVAIHDLHGATESFATIAHDMRPQRRLEDTLKRALDELSAPIIQVWDGVLALPVIGLVDSVRAARMMDSLLDAVAQSQCKVAVLDLTGVRTVDTATLDHMFKMVSATGLLGCRCVVSGISGQVAQTIAHLGVDLSGLQTFRSLREALRLGLQRAQAQVA